MQGREVQGPRASKHLAMHMQSGGGDGSQQAFEDRQLHIVIGNVIASAQQLHRLRLHPNPH